MALRKQGEYVAQAMKSCFGDKLAKIMDFENPTKTSRTSQDEEREASPTPVAAPPEGTALLKRAEIGWMQSIVGHKEKIPNRLTWEGAATILEKRMSDKQVVGMINKCIQAHFPKKKIPTAKAKRIQLVLGIVNGSEV